MHSKDSPKGHFLLADANALGGYLEEPFERLITTLAPVSLPVVGGLTTARSDEFQLDHIVGVGSAHSLVSGKPGRGNEPISILVKTVIERLNILDVVTADRIVAQLSATLGPSAETTRISFAGTSFEGLKVGGFACRVRTDFGIKGRPTESANSEPTQGLQFDQVRKHFPIVKSIEPDNCHIDDIPATLHGDHVDIPGFGRFQFGDCRLSGGVLQFVAVRAQLGCPVKGAVGVGTLNLKGHPYPP